MNQQRRLPFLIGIIIGAILAIVEPRGIRDLMGEMHAWLRRRVNGEARTKGVS